MAPQKEIDHHLKGSIKSGVMKSADTMAIQVQTGYPDLRRLIVSTIDAIHDSNLGVRIVHQSNLANTQRLQPTADYRGTTITVSQQALEPIVLCPELRVAHRIDFESRQEMRLFLH